MTGQTPAPQIGEMNKWLRESQLPSADTPWGASAGADESERYLTNC